MKACKEDVRSCSKHSLCSSDCTEEIRSLVKETAMNINLDSVLMKACKEEVRSCSKHSLCSSDCTEEIRSLVKETAMNIN